MYVITGALGQTGKVVCDTLLKNNQKIRMIVRRENEETQKYKELGAEIFVCNLNDLDSLVKAFNGANGAYLMNPPSYMSQNLFDDAKLINSNLISAANEAELKHIVILSSVGAQHDKGTGNIITNHNLEVQAKNFKGVCTTLRAANFMENWLWSMQTVLKDSILPSMFLPLEKKLPMISAQDIGRIAGERLMKNPKESTLVELHGSKEYSPYDAAESLSFLLNKEIKAIEVPRETWDDYFKSIDFPEVTRQGFCELFDGFNSNHTVFENSHEKEIGAISLDKVFSQALT